MKEYKQLKNIFKRQSHLQYLERILSWDEAVMMPPGAGNTRANALATLNRTTQKLLINKKIQALIDATKNTDNLSSWDAANLAWIEKRYKLANCIPLKLTEKFTNASILSQQAWRVLREENKWLEFLPLLENTFNHSKEIADRVSQVLQMSPYDALIDSYAPGFNQKAIDVYFSDLKNTLPGLIKEIQNKQQNEKPFLIPEGPFETEKQKEIGLEIMKTLGFNFEIGRLDVSHHPFCSGGPRDVRITTRYAKDDLFCSIFAICHETGHALYEQGLPAKWLDQPVGQIHSMAMHESQSLLIETEVCRSKAFHTYLSLILAKKFGKQKAFETQNLHKMSMKVEPDLIRVEADEVTYPLHIILRYEIEKSLFSNQLTIKDLPDYWDTMMTNYLGISTKGNYKDGVMQDVHWPAGLFGYFPAYTLGRLIASQLFAKYKQITPAHDQFIEEQNFTPLNNWLKENVYNYGLSMDVQDYLLKVTGKKLETRFFINHIKERYLTN